MHRAQNAGFLIAAILASGVVVGSIAEAAPRSGASANGMPPYRDSLGIVARLSNEENEPFLFEGVKPADGVFDGYLNAIERFPHVRDCLVESEGLAAFPELGALAWQEMTGPGDVAVCVFRVASSYDSVDNLERWFAAQGFVMRTRTYDGGLGTSKEFKTLDVQASYALEHRDLPYNAGLLHAWFVSVFCRSFSVWVTYLADGTVKSVQAASMCK